MVASVFVTCQPLSQLMFSEAQVVPPTQLKEGEEGGGGIKSSPICLWRLQSVGCWFFSASVRFLSPLPLRASTPTAALGKGEQGAPASRDRDPHRCVEKPPSPTRVRLAPGQQLCPSAPLRARFKAGGRGERRGTGAASAGVRARVGNGHGGTGAGPPPRRSPVAPGRRRFAASVRVAGSRLSGPGRPHRAGAGAGSPPSDVLAFQIWREVALTYPERVGGKGRERGEEGGLPCSALSLARSSGRRFACARGLRQPAWDHRFWEGRLSRMRR